VRGKKAKRNSVIVKDRRVHPRRKFQEERRKKYTWSKADYCVGGEGSINFAARKGRDRMRSRWKISGAGGAKKRENVRQLKRRVDLTHKEGE